METNTANEAAIAYTPCATAENETSLDEFAQNIADIFMADSRKVVEFACWDEEWDADGLVHELEKYDLVYRRTDDVTILVAFDYKAFR